MTIFGTGEFALLAHEYFQKDSSYNVSEFVVDEEFMPSESKINRIPILSTANFIKTFNARSRKLFVAIPASRMNRSRTEVKDRLSRYGFTFASYISSKAFVWDKTKVGENSFVFEHNVIQPFVSIGENCVLWSGNHVGHRSNIFNNSFVTSHCVISGYCTIGENSFLGVNSTIIDNISIAEFTLVGAGSLVNRNTDPYGVYIGSPARKITDKSSLDTRI